MHFGSWSLNHDNWSSEHSTEPIEQIMPSYQYVVNVFEVVIIAINGWYLFFLSGNGDIICSYCQSTLKNLFNKYDYFSFKTISCIIFIYVGIVFAL